MLWALAFALFQERNHECPAQPPSQVEIDKAVARGVEYLRSVMKKAELDLDAHGGHTLEELMLAALAYGGLPEAHEEVQWLLKRSLSHAPAKTYETVLLCVALDKFDAEFYTWKLVECGQFLLDNECENGQWSYGRPTELDAKTKKLIEELKVWGEQRRKKRAKNKDSTKSRLKIELKPKPLGQPSGDNSNTQVAALGLRICGDAGIVFPKANLELARTWWLDNQRNDGSWGYGAGADQGDGYISMTAGGVSSLRVLQDLIERGLPKRSRDAKAGTVAASVDRGTKWMGENFTYHPRYAVFMRAPYSHYSIERVGILGSLEKIGPHPWYAEGAYDLLRSQQSDGSWTLSRARGKDEKETTKWAIIDTSIAILFFKRSVRPPVASGDDRKKP